MPDWKILAGLLFASVAVSGHLLVVLDRKLKPVYGEIAAWRLIFAGYVLLFLETAIGLFLVMSWLPVYFRFFNYGFCGIMLTKVICYDIGFSLWAKRRHELLDPKRWTPPEN